MPVHVVWWAHTETTAAWLQQWLRAQSLNYLLSPSQNNKNEAKLTAFCLLLPDTVLSVHLLPTPQLHTQNTAY